MFNTGTTVGVSANVFGGGFPSKFIPSFAWGGIGETETFRLPRAFETAGKAMGRRSLTFGETDQEILQKVFELEARNRTWESKS